MMVSSGLNRRKTWSPHMDNRRRECGQTLVELALVLPCFCLGVFMAVQLMTYCHNMIELQRMAQVMSGRQSYSRDQTGYNFFDSLWGNTTPLSQKPVFERPTVWRRFRGLSTLQQTGWFFRTQLSTTLLPGDGILSSLTKTRLFAAAE